LPELEELQSAALEICGEVLEAVDARRALLRAVELDGGALRVGDTRFDLSGHTTTKIFSVALGKAASAMAAALDARLGDTLSRGVLSAPTADAGLATRHAGLDARDVRLDAPHVRLDARRVGPGSAGLGARWSVFEGGHPLPNAASLEAARAAFDLLREANDSAALVIFLVSGGGSALMESPRDLRLTLEDVRAANRVLVSCGARIDEVNAVRRALSAVKGGGLSACAPRAAQVTLVVSDVGAGRAYDVASGPTLPPPAGSPSAEEIVARYGLASSLPAPVLRALEESGAPPRHGVSRARTHDELPVAGARDALRACHVLLDNGDACAAAAEAARARGFAVEVAQDLAEQPVGEGAAALVARLASLYVREGAGRRGVCLISGGEFSCPVRGRGTGGRNSETALRCAFEFERIARGRGACGLPAHVVALCAGTDGVDGNSPAAGALADKTTLARARALGLNAVEFLEGSDAYTLFERLGDALVTGATGTNVRDVRILLAAG
jgi:glycerate 2-kinase